MNDKLTAEISIAILLTLCVVLAITIQVKNTRIAALEELLTRMEYQYERHTDIEGVGMGN